MEAVLRDQYEKEIESPFTDSLTGLCTHGFFQACLEREISRHQRHGEPFSLALIDVDWFSGYNRRHGSLEGDKALKNVAHEITQNIREVDLAARYSGDVFAVIFIRCKVAQAETAADRIRKAIEEKAGKRLTASIGIASYSTELTKDAFLNKAEDALLQAKMRGKNRVFLTEETESPQEESPPRVLIVDDQHEVRRMLAASLRTLGKNFDVLEVPSGEEALLISSQLSLDLVVADVRLPGMSGLEMVARLQKRTPQTRIILVTGVDEPRLRRQVADAGADAFFYKPVEMADFLDAVERCLGLAGEAFPLPPVAEEPVAVKGHKTTPLPG
ncbi:MAG: diguanylate cyclase, partial [Syntrophobacteraceae bacterium]|nr:diguanylate cyclase [Syntrophobacteraceae bacterium]